jgi:hypothetical protein
MNSCVALGQRGGDWASKWVGPAGLGRPAYAHFGPASGLLCPVLLPESSKVFPLLHVGPCRKFLFRLDEAPCPAKFGSFLTGSSEFFIFSGLVLGLLGDMFTSLPDLSGLKGLVMRWLMNLSRKSCF